MKNFLLEHKIQRIEAQGNDDLLLILEFGPRDYATHELHHLLRRTRQQAFAAARIQQWLFVIGASISLWVGAGFLCAAFGQLLLGYLFLILIPVCCLSLVAGHFYLRRRHPTHRHSQTISQVIQQELERRRKDASIF